MGFRGFAAVVGAAAALIAGAPAAAQPDDLIIVMGGISDISDFDEETFEGRIEYSSGLTDLPLLPFFRGVGPLAGLMVTGKGGVFAYAGIYGDFVIGDRFIIRPEGAIGAFREGGGKDLGGVFEIHSALTFAYEFDNKARLGITVTHISNTGINGSNPGLDSLLLSYSIPIDPIF